MTNKLNIGWRRNKVIEYMAHGFTNQSEIAQIMQIPLSTINKDVMFLRQQAKENVVKYGETFAFEFDKCLTEITAIQKESWLTSKTTKYERNKILALSLAKDCLQFKIDLITNVEVINKTTNFIETKKRRLKQVQEEELTEQSAVPVDYGFEERQDQQVISL